MEQIKAVILAAGKGTRLQTEGVDLPKVLRQANGRPLLGWVLEALDFIPAADRILVVGYQGEKVRAACPDYPWALQAQQLGTGHAVLSAAPMLKDFQGDVLVCCGDMPLISRDSYRALVTLHRQEGNACTLLSDVSGVERPGYGRVVRDEAGRFLRIVEAKDCSPAEAALREYNSGVYVFACQALLGALGALRPENAQAEYYLTDVPGILLAQHKAVGACARDLWDEIIGVNTVEQLQEVETLLKNRK